MKRIRLSIVFILLLLVINTSYFINVKASASFNPTSLETIDLGYGVTLDKYVGTSKSDFITTPGVWPGQTNIDGRGREIYTANIDKNSSAKVVQWTYNSGVENSWARVTLESIAKDYEKKHPGQKVLVATNNWLSNTNVDNSGELDAVQSCDGLNYRVSDKQGTADNLTFKHEYIKRPNFLGFDETGKKAYYTNDWSSSNYTSYLAISFYEKHKKTPTDFKITKINEEPLDGEIAIYFSNYKGKESINNSKIYQMLGTSLRHDKREGSDFVERDAFALGTFVKFSDKIDFNYDNVDVYTYYIVSKNKEFDSLDINNKQLLAQYEFLGDYANVVGATTYYYHIVRDGKCYPSDFGNWDEINCEVHPRTAFIIKEDGSFALSVIDGRDAKNGRTGMDYEDMANFYKTMYNAYNVFNYDGGGSSCMIVANKDGDFDIVNNPSDGNERRVANATLIVVDLPFTVEQETNDEHKIILNVSLLNDNITKIYASLDEKRIEVKDGKIEFSSLKEASNYDIIFTYDTLEEKNLLGPVFKGKTCNLFAQLESFNAIDVDTSKATVEIKLKDPGSSFFQMKVEFNGKTEYFNELNMKLYYSLLEPNTNYKVKLTVYSYNETANYHEETYTLEFKTQNDKKGCCNKKALDIITFITFLSVTFIYIKKKINE